ncbi:hypothetical protein [Pseudomonas serbica]|uniref:hypothetical protein n=1 Tax=Pseudomonas serbica TaxID=2965074 RepID=UPI00237C34D6|nr:hypothetical protein [Pseudomonas serbica]
MTDELSKITADIAFHDEVLAAIAAAGAKRQAITHEAHRFTAEESQMFEHIESARIGLIARKRRIEIIGR